MTVQRSLRQFSTLGNHRRDLGIQMTILFITILSTLVIGAVLYPIVRSSSDTDKQDSVETSDKTSRMAVDGLDLAKLDLAVGNLDQESYDQLEEKYILESGLLDSENSSDRENE